MQRGNRTLQERLVKGLRLAGVSHMEDGNAFLPGFIDRFNVGFSVVPACQDNLHRALTVTPDRLRDILCRREQRCLGQQLSLPYERKLLIVERNAITERAVEQYVDIYDFADSRLEVREACPCPVPCSTRTSA